ncbi:MAG: arsenic resistance N-acetyltransferase ArsN2 [Synechococcaceae cyanobacterium]|nr:arsenic resistance N-acetyltransferase ArsN2 [Synechococcaceae cyanobacterium]
MESYELVAAARSDWHSIRALLLANDLEPTGLEPHITTTLVAVDGGTVVGCIALEPYGRQALLRSLAVDPGRHRSGIGSALVAAVLELARRMSADAVYLLTETAAEYFPRFGFTPTTREAVPELVRRSVEFTTVCPESAAVMVLELRRPA